ncbi:hypothetical protein BKA63DRAFT_486113 [Paraphoma chrysanthemicola]|nr:hypothetical protein BKA63DRAFT_486113 [Paraphoma chrysanthemicola]
MDDDTEILGNLNAEAMLSDSRSGDMTFNYSTTSPPEDVPLPTSPSPMEIGPHTEVLLHSLRGAGYHGALINGLAELFREGVESQTTVEDQDMPLEGYWDERLEVNVERLAEMVDRLQRHCMERTGFNQDHIPAHQNANPDQSLRKSSSQQPFQKSVVSLPRTANVAQGSTHLLPSISSHTECRVGDSTSQSASPEASDAVRSEFTEPEMSAEELAREIRYALLSALYRYNIEKGYKMVETWEKALCYLNEGEDVYEPAEEEGTWDKAEGHDKDGEVGYGSDDEDDELYG